MADSIVSWIFFDFVFSGSDLDYASGSGGAFV